MNSKDEQAWRLLLIDDDEDDFLLTRVMLDQSRRRKIEVVWAPDYAQGQYELENNHYDAVLVDYDLGDRNGIELIRQYSSQYPAPLILFTGRGSHEIDLEAMSAGATMYLSKAEANPLLLDRIIRYAIERHQVEYALRQSEDKFANAFEHNPAAMAITRSSDSLYIDANESFCSIFGYTREEIIGHSTVELGFLPLEKREEVFNQFRQDGFIRNLEIEVTARGGEQHFILLSLDRVIVSGEPSVLGTLIDITQSKHAENARRMLEEMFEKAFRSNPVAMAITRLSDGQYLDVNDAYSRLSGYVLDELVGASPLEVGFYFEPQEREKVIAMLTENGSVRNYEMKVRHKSGAVSSHLFSFEAIDLHGEPSILATIIDSAR